MVHRCVNVETFAKTMRRSEITLANQVETAFLKRAQLVRGQLNELPTNGEREHTHASTIWPKHFDLECCSNGAFVVFNHKLFTHELKQSLNSRSIRIRYDFPHRIQGVDKARLL